MTTAPALDPREHILDKALDLMASRGAEAMTMRELADACGIAVSGLYYYFASKQALLAAVIQERQWDVRLAEIPNDLTEQPPRQRLASIAEAIFRGSLEEQRVWRVLLAEGSRSNGDAVGVGRGLVGDVTAGFGRWIEALFPEVGDKEAMSRLFVGELFAFLLEVLFLGEEDALGNARTRTTALASLLFPAG